MKRGLGELAEHYQVEERKSSMSKMPDLPTYKFVVRAYDVAEHAVTDEFPVSASYFQETGQFTVFKDAGHVVVDAFRTDTVMRVTRTGDPSYGG